MPQQAAADPTLPKNPGTWRLQTVLALIALAGTLATPILGYRLGAADKANDTKQRTIADQQATIDMLRSENAMLRAQEANPVVPASPSSSSPAPSPEVGKQRRSGTLTLPFLYCADLDSAAPDWRMTNADCGSGQDVLLGQDFQGLRAVEGVQLAVVQHAQASFAGCRAETALSEAIPYDRLQPKTLICARTTEKNVALLEIVTIDGAPTQPGKITFNVTVWVPQAG